MEVGPRPTARVTQSRVRVGTLRVPHPKVTPNGITPSINNLLMMFEYQGCGSVTGRSHIDTQNRTLLKLEAYPAPISLLDSELPRDRSPVGWHVSLLSRRLPHS